MTLALLALGFAQIAFSSEIFDDIFEEPQFQELPGSVQTRYRTERERLESLVGSTNPCEVTLGQVRGALRFPSSHPYDRLTDHSVLNGLGSGHWSKFDYRRAPADIMSALGVLEFLVESDRLVIIQLGHAHSITVLAFLADQGFHPVLNMGDSGMGPLWTAQPLGALKYTFKLFEQAQRSQSQDTPKKVAIAYDFHDFELKDRGFPTVEEIETNSGGRVVWVIESPTNERIPLADRAAFDEISEFVEADRTIEPPRRLAELGIELSGRTLVGRNFEHLPAAFFEYLDAPEIELDLLTIFPYRGMPRRHSRNSIRPEF